VAKALNIRNPRQLVPLSMRAKALHGAHRDEIDDEPTSALAFGAGQGNIDWDAGDEVEGQFADDEETGECWEEEILAEERAIVADDIAKAEVALLKEEEKGSKVEGEEEENEVLLGLHGASKVDRRDSGDFSDATDEFGLDDGYRSSGDIDAGYEAAKARKSMQVPTPSSSVHDLGIGTLGASSAHRNRSRLTNQSSSCVGPKTKLDRLYEQEVEAYESEVAERELLAAALRSAGAETGTRTNATGRKAGAKKAGVGSGAWGDSTRSSGGLGADTRAGPPVVAQEKLDAIAAKFQGIMRSQVELQKIAEEAEVERQRRDGAMITDLQVKTVLLKEIGKQLLLKEGAEFRRQPAGRLDDFRGAEEWKEWFAPYSAGKSEEYKSAVMEKIKMLWVQLCFQDEATKVWIAHEAYLGAARKAAGGLAKPARSRKASGKKGGVGKAGALRGTERGKKGKGKKGGVGARNGVRKEDDRPGANSPGWQSQNSSVRGSPTASTYSFPDGSRSSVGGFLGESPCSTTASSSEAPCPDYLYDVDYGEGTDGGRVSAHGALDSEGFYSGGALG